MGEAGVAAMEFGLVAVPFFFLLIATIDLGRYFMTVQSVNTVANETARSALINCFRKTMPGACTLTSAQLQAAEASTPFLDTASLTLTPAQSQNGTGNTITVTASYPFTFIFPIFASALNTVSDSVTITY